MRNVGLGATGIEAEDEALASIAAYASGDARTALNALEVASQLAGGRGETLISKALAAEAMQRRMLLYDKKGEQHYDIISALHKSVRNSDPDAALYWLGRMLEAGEDPMYCARRLVRMAVEDVGLAAPEALNLCLSARDAMHFLGSPEGDLALAQAAVYLALAPKSKRCLHGLRSRQGGYSKDSCGACAAASAERSNAADEGAGLWQGVPVRA